MVKKIPLSGVFYWLNKMLDEHWGYIWGTAGVLCTQAVIERSASNPKNPNPDLTRKEGKKWIGHMVEDCSGAIVKIYDEYGLKIPHGSSSMVQLGYIVDCGSVPHPGWAALIDPTPDTPDNNHIGIVSEDGQYVYEAKGTVAGFVKTKLSSTKFNKFGRFKDVDYNDEGGGNMDTPYYAKVVTQSGALNVRTGPGTNYIKIGSVPKDAIVTVKTHMESWDFIEYRKLQGYASNAFLEPLEPVPDTGNDDIKDETGKVTEEHIMQILAIADDLYQIADKLKLIVRGDAGGDTH